MKGIDIYHFNKYKYSIVSMESHPCLSDETDQDKITTTINIHIIPHFLLSK